MKFWDYTKEERAEWRSLEMTKAFAAELKALLDECAEGVLAGLRGNNIHGATWGGGVGEGFSKARDIAVNE